MGTIREVFEILIETGSYQWIISGNPCVVGKSEAFKDNLPFGCTRNSVVDVPSGKSDVLVILLFLLSLSLLSDSD